MDIFGKKKQEERIAELEAERAKLEREKEQLEQTLDKRDEKIRKLASANQEANLALKAMEQKARAVEAAAATVRSPAAKTECNDDNLLHPWKPSPRELDMLLERLKRLRSPREDLLVAAFPDSVTEDSGLPPQIIQSAMAVKSERGRIIVYCPQLFSLQLIPPFPIKERASWTESTFNLALIEEMMDTSSLVVSAHAGDTFLGVALSRESFDVRELVESEVKEKHSKGGWSQKRFERLREEDIKNHIDAVKDTLSQLAGRYGSIVQYAVLGGEESLIRQIRPSISLPIVERRLEQHDEKDPGSLLDQVYGFTCYRIEI